MANLEIAIQQFQEAANTTPKDHPDRAGRLHSLGAGYQDRYLRTAAMTDLEIAIQQYQKAVNHSPSPIIIRLDSSQDSFHRMQKLETSRWPIIVGLASDATAAAFQVGEAPLVALRLLEQGRGVLAVSIEEMRANMLELHKSHPKLADEFVRLRDGVDSLITRDTALVDGSRKSSLQVRAIRRASAGHKLNELIVEICIQPRFENFLLPPSEQEIQDATKCGPIVVINVREYRCDALLLSDIRYDPWPCPI